MYELFIALFAAVALVFMLGLFMAYLTRNGNFKFEQIGAFLVLAVVGLAIFGYRELVGEKQLGILADPGK